jgi:hypothetical protein
VNSLGEFGTEQMTGDDHAYKGSRFSELRDALFANPYQDAADWKCIRGLDVSAPYDLAAATKAFFPRLKGHARQLRKALQHLSRNDQAFSGLDVDVLLGGESVA